MYCCAHFVFSTPALESPGSLTSLRLPLLLLHACILVAFATLTRMHTRSQAQVWTTNIDTAQCMETMYSQPSPSHRTNCNRHRSPTPNAQTFPHKASVGLSSGWPPTAKAASAPDIPTVIPTCRHLCSRLPSAVAFSTGGPSDQGVNGGRWECAWHVHSTVSRS